MSDDKIQLTTNIVTKCENDNGDISLEKKALDRMVAEGYKYRALSHNGASEVLDPIEDEEKRTQRRRVQKLKILLFVGLILVIGLVGVIVVQYSGKDEEMPTCRTTSCVKSSAYILNKMSTDIDPCDDFYTFSCGNWLKTTQIPPSKSRYGSFSQISDEITLIMKGILEVDEKLYKGKKSTAIHKAKTYFDMCMNDTQITEQDIYPALKLIGDIGSWSLTSDITYGVFDPAAWKVEDAVLRSHRYGFGPLFLMSVGTDEKNSSQYMLTFQQSGLTLGNPMLYFSNHTNQEKLKTAFIQYATDVVTLLGAAGDVDKSINDLYNFEQRLAEIHVPAEQLLDPIKIYHAMTLQKLGESIFGDWLNLETYVQGIFGNIKTIPTDSEVVVYTPEYFTKLQSLLAQTDTQTLANYVVWHSVSGLVGYLTKNFTDAALKLDSVQNGIHEYPPQWKRCLSKTTSALGYATGALYVQEHFAEDSKQEVESLFEEIRTAFIANLYDLEWMEDDTRAYAVKKANDVTKMLGYPDYITDPAKLDEHYENMTLIQGKFFESKLSELIFYKQKNLRHLGSVPDKTEWSMVPTDVNGYYSSESNHVVFPAGLLRPPMYNPTTPRSFKFGSFGMICGHELTHGFDNNGRLFDRNGNLRNWWTNASTQNFNVLTQCFVDFYSNYSINGTHLNGETTLGENIADNGGLNIAYLAYQSWLKKNNGADSFSLPGMQYKPDQLFFIGMAQMWCSHYTPEYEQQAILNDPHSIAKYRVLGSMSNSEFFANAFNCPKNSRMNPEKKCVVW